MEKKEAITVEPKYRIIAPDVNRLLGCYEGFQNPEQPSVALMEALDHLCFLRICAS